MSMDIYNGLDPKDKEIIRQYRSLFSSPMGKEVLKNMLYHLNYFKSNISTPEQIARNNYAKELLENIGAFDGEAFANSIVNAITAGDIPVDPTTTEGDK